MSETKSDILTMAREAVELYHGFSTLRGSEERALLLAQEVIRLSEENAKYNALYVGERYKPADRAVIQAQIKTLEKCAKWYCDYCSSGYPVQIYKNNVDVCHQMTDGSWSGWCGCPRIQREIARLRGQLSVHNGVEAAK